MSLRTLLGLERAGSAGAVFQATRKAYLDAKVQSLSPTGPPRFRRDFAYATVQMIGILINESESIRLRIRESDSFDLRAEGLTGWDNDFAGLKLRYVDYKRFFELNPLAWKPPEEWDGIDSSEYERLIEGPIFLWSIDDCRKRWGTARSAPACEGPDLMMALSLVHQVTVAEEFENQITSSFWLFDLTLNEFVEFYADIAKAAAKAIVQAVGKAVAGTFGGGDSNSWIHYLLGAAAIGGVGYAIYRHERPNKER